MANPQKIKDLYPARFNERGSTLFWEYKNLLLNAITIEGMDFVTERFVKNQLIDVGKVGYDRMVDKWAAVYGEGLNELRDPTTLIFVYPNRAAVTRPAYYEPSEDGAYQILGMPTPFSLAAMIDESVRVQKLCDNGAMQNLAACKNPLYVIVNDDEMLLSVHHAIEQQQEGKPVVLVSKGIGDAVKGMATGVQYIADKYADYRDRERDHLLNKLGVMTANINKRERVQVGEVNATVGQCEDYIYLMIDTFNKQMETYDLPYKMKLNAALEELYNPNNADESEEQNDGKLEHNS